jgi:predicted DNA-binding protein
MEREDNRTTIALTPETKERLNSYGKFGETHDKVLLRILDEVDECRKKKK